MGSSEQQPTQREHGITQHPLEQEEHRQAQVPPRPQAEDGADSSAAGSRRGHRLSRQEGNQDAVSSENNFEGKGGKGGKTGGSRAGLLGSRKAPKGRR
jgi:hypothetical protein